MAIDDVNAELAQRALLYSRRKLPFGRTLLLSSSPPARMAPGVEYLECPRMPTREAYNHFVLRELHAYINTAYALSIQTDGFVLHPERWNPSFLEYDYIGAPWPASGWSRVHRVGNSGFCLRSLRLLQATAALPEALLSVHRRRWKEITDDLFTCIDARDALTGLTFAPPELAWRFSQEQPTPEGFDLDRAFGFHGRMTKVTTRACLRLEAICT